jgi:hypothetical protein
VSIGAASAPGPIGSAGGVVEACNLVNVLPSGWPTVSERCPSVPAALETRADSTAADCGRGLSAPVLVEGATEAGIRSATWLVPEPLSRGGPERFEELCGEL